MDLVDYENMFEIPKFDYINMNNIILPVLYTDSGLKISLCLTKEEWIDAYRMFLKYVDDEYIKYIFSDLSVTERMINNFFLGFNRTQNCIIEGGYGNKLLFVVYKGETSVGSIGIVDDCDNYYLALFIDKIYSGKGYGTDTVNAILTMLKQIFNDYNENTNMFDWYSYPKPVIWRCNETNYASVKIAEKTGFVKTGKGVHYLSGTEYVQFEKILKN